MHVRGGTGARALWGSILVFSICFFAVLAPAADAFYAGPFSTCEAIQSGIDKHCYAISNWYMKDGYSSGVNGATLEILNNGSSIPETPQSAAEGYFATNEMWTGFHDIPNSWIETGEITSHPYGKPQTQPEAFYAFKNQSSPFNFFTAPVSLPAGGWFWVETLYVGNGIWDAYIEGAGPFQMTTNLPGGADTPQNGLEYDAPGVSNSGESRSPVWEAPSGQWQYGWYDPYSTAVRAAPGWETFNNWAGYETAYACAQPTGTPGAVKWTSWPYPNPDPQSCFYGDHQVYSDILSGGTAAPTSELQAVAGREPGEQPPVNVSDWPAPVQTGNRMTVAGLKARVTEIAAELGDSSPTAVQAVESTRGAALTTMNPGSRLPDTTGTQSWAAPLKAWYGQVTYTVTAHGRFRFGGPVPPGETSPTGTALTLILDAHSGAITMLGLDNESSSADLGSLGAVKGL